MKTVRALCNVICRLLRVSPRNYIEVSSRNCRTFSRHPIYISKDVRFNSSDGNACDDHDLADDNLVHVFPQTERKNLFPQMDELCFRKVLGATSVSHLMSVLRDHESDLSVKHACQVIATLNDLKNQSRHSRTVTKSVNEALVSSQFANLCGMIEQNIHALTNNTLVMTMYCTKTLGNSPAMGRLCGALFDECWGRFPTTLFSLLELSALSAAVMNYGLKGLMLQSKIVALLQTRVDRCDSEDDLRHIAAVVGTAYPVVTSNFVDNILTKCEEFLQENEITNPATSLACLQALVSENHDLSNTRVVQKLYDSLRDLIPSLTLKQLIILFLTLRYSDSDTYDMLVNISNRAEKLVEQTDHVLDQLTLLNCIDPIALKRIEARALEILSNSCSELTFTYYGSKFTRVLRNLRCSNVSVADSFWSECLSLMNSERDEQLICRLYLRFKLSYQSYLHATLETKLKEALINRLRLHAGLYPSNVALIASLFIITGKQPLPDILFERVTSVGAQWPVADVETVSKCLKIALSACRNRRLYQQLLHIRNILDERTAHLIPYVSSLSDVRQLSAACLDRQRSFNDGLFFDLMDRYHLFLPRLSSKNVLAISHKIGEAAYFCPTLLDGMAMYIIKNFDTGLTGWSIANFLYACYKVSYLPIEDEEVISASIKAIKRDFSLLTCLKILQAASALGLFRSLPAFMVHSIFNTDFLEKLDDEMQASISTRGNKFRHSLFEVNRIVCLEYPELNVPWFHETYGEALVFQAPFRKSKFESEVLEILTHVLGGQAYSRANVFTPYYYHLNFEAILDASKTPLMLSDYGASWDCNRTSDKHRSGISPDLPPGAQRLAINVLTEKAYCSNVRHMKGTLQLKRRHLEIMNYKVIEIPYFEWYSMQNADRQARIKYLEQKLFLSS